MNLGRIDEALPFVRKIRFPLNQIENVDCVLCPPFTVLAPIAEILKPTRILLGAQNIHWKESGAFTGEISPSMLAGLCQYVIIGHSERRIGLTLNPPSSSHGQAGEDDMAVNYKVKAAISHGLCPIICVGEDLEQNESGKTHQFITGQVHAALSGLSAAQASRCVIAYEPIWAIGTGKAATPAVVNRIIGLTVRGAIAEIFGEAVAQTIRVQYGGSVNADNIEAFMQMPEIDGALVGGASLKPDFGELLQRASAAIL